MNERIQEFAKQCGDWNGETLEMNDVGIAKFAELIVKECLRQAKEVVIPITADTIESKIKEHFGVKE